MHRHVSFRWAVSAVAAGGLLFAAGCAVSSTAATHLTPSLASSAASSAALSAANVHPQIGGSYRWEIYNGSGEAVRISTNQSVCMAKTIPSMKLSFRQTLSDVVETDAEHGDCWLAWNESAFSIVYKNASDPSKMREVVYNKGALSSWRVSGESGSGLSPDFKIVITYPNGLKTTTYKVHIYS